MRSVAKALRDAFLCWPPSAGFWCQWFLSSATRTLNEGGGSDRRELEYKGPRH